MGGELECPHCDGTSFNLQISGYQEKASFAQTDEGRVYVVDAQTVTVTDHDPEKLRCRSCDATISEDDLAGKRPYDPNSAKLEEFVDG